MKIVILDRATLGFDVDISVFEKYGTVISYDFTKKTIEKNMDNPFIKGINEFLRGLYDPKNYKF